MTFYTPEIGVTLSELRKDVEFLKLRYSLDLKGKSEGRLILRSVFLVFFCLSCLLLLFSFCRSVFMFACLAFYLYPEWSKRVMGKVRRGELRRGSKGLYRTTQHPYFSLYFPLFPSLFLFDLI